MPKIAYVEKNLGLAKLQRIAQANAIIAEYAQQGFTLTLRQLYYQFVSRDLIANNLREYKNLGEAINDGRLVGLIDWDAIEDRTRNLARLATWDAPTEIVSACAEQFRIDKWATQPYRPEVWIEKDALVGVIERVCRNLAVPFLACRGYTSQSEMWAGAMRLEEYATNGQTPIILYFGDHDPSGIDMTRDVLDRMQMFMGGLEVRRLALNRPQVDRYDPPPNPAKLTDSRAAGYIAEHGRQSWELDALEPSVIVALIRDTVLALRDEEAWKEKVAEEEEHRELLMAASERWSDVAEFLRDNRAE